jgi:hypothetical protein
MSNSSSIGDAATTNINSGIQKDGSMSTTSATASEATVTVTGNGNDGKSNQKEQLSSPSSLASKPSSVPLSDNKRYPYQDHVLHWSFQTTSSGQA